MADPKQFEPSPMLQTRLMDIEAKRRNMLPTPLLGTVVGWSQDGSVMPNGDPFIGHVFRRLEPGKVDLQLIGGPTVQLRGGVLYVKHPDMMKRTDARIGAGGCWFYLESLENPDYQPPKRDFELHKRKLDQAEKSALADEDRRNRLAEDRARKQAAAKQGAPAIVK
jgi:hypothetical protein